MAKNEEVKSARFRQQLSELEMKALRAQMNPHFIFNCIDSINRMVLSGEGGDASRYLTKFAKLIRLMLENSRNPHRIAGRRADNAGSLFTVGKPAV